MKEKVFDGNGNVFGANKKKHPIREMMEKGGLVNEEEFERMLAEEDEDNKVETMKCIENTLLEIKTMLFEIILIISSNRQD